MKDPKIISLVEAIVNETETMKNAYFFQPCGNASSRRWYDEKHFHEKVEWTEGNSVYIAEYTVKSSCRNVYASGYYTKNGNKTTLTAIKNSLKRMKGENAA